MASGQFAYAWFRCFSAGSVGVLDGFGLAVRVSARVTLQLVLGFALGLALDLRLPKPPPKWFSVV